MKLLFFTCISILLISCSKDKLTASGDKTSETRFPGAFTGITTSGSTPVQISYGTELKVEVKGSNNLIPYFKSKIINGTLYLGYENASVQHDDIEVNLTLPIIKKIALSGSGKIELNGNFKPVDELKISISGSGNILARDVFETEETTVNISGSGKADILKIVSNEAEVDISGSGNASLNILKKLKARISGSGKIYYSGSPEVDADVSGSGKVIKL